jgi:hypothetical protein
MSTGATDMAYLRPKGMQCYAIGPATDVEDGPKGFGKRMCPLSTDESKTVQPKSMASTT